MAQPVKLSDELINAARQCAEISHRSLAAQVEHWSTLGRAIEGALTIDQAAQLKCVVREPPAPAYAVSGDGLAAALTQSIAKALSAEARGDFRRELLQATQPIYGTDAVFPGMIVRRNVDGSVTPGRWTGQQFVAAEVPTVKTAAEPKAARRGRTRR
jgi:hypothetical protein